MRWRVFRGKKYDWLIRPVVDDPEFFLFEAADEGSVVRQHAYVESYDFSGYAERLLNIGLRGLRARDIGGKNYIKNQGRD